MKHGAYYWTPRVEGRQLMHHLGREYESALKQYYEGEGVPKENQQIWRPEKKDARNWRLRLFSNVKAQARSRGIEFSITIDDIVHLATLADGRCQVTKIPFEHRWAKDECRRPWAPSLDRIDPHKGYTADNCRLVAVAVNIAMNNWGVDVLLKIGRALKEQRLI